MGIPIFFVPFLCCSNLVKKAIKKNFSGRVNEQHDDIGNILKHQEVPESFRRCQEASGSIREAQHENPKLDTRISFVCPLFVLLRHTRTTPPEIFNGLDWRALVESRPPNIQRIAFFFGNYFFGNYFFYNYFLFFLFLRFLKIFLRFLNFLTIFYYFF